MCARTDPPGGETSPWGPDRALRWLECAASGNSRVARLRGARRRPAVGARQTSRGGRVSDDDRETRPDRPSAPPPSASGGEPPAPPPGAGEPGSADTTLPRIERELGSRVRVTLRPTSDEEGATSAAPSGEETPFQGKYRLLGELGRGGVGLVLQARDVDLGREVAIKVLRDEYQRRPEIVRRFVEEAQIGGQLQHPGVVPVYDLGLQEGRPFFAMKLIRGKSLAELLEARDDVKADRRRFLGIFEQIAQTLAYAHARGVIHRDLKPANVMVGAFGEVQVVDWGMGKVLGGDDTPEEPLPADVPVEPASEEVDRPDLRSTLGSAMGTPGYMPPEQARGALGEIDTRSDVFALGAILLEILTGQPAQGGTPMERLVKALRADPGDWQDRLAGAEADEDLVALVSSCLSADRDARLASAREVAERVTSDLSAVEERARRALLDAAHARTEAAEAQAREAQSRARAAQEQARAEREEAAAEQARLRADAERRRRRATLAIAVVLLVGVVGTLWSLVQANEQRRIADEARAAEAKRAEGNGSRTRRPTAASRRCSRRTTSWGRSSSP